MIIYHLHEILENRSVRSNLTSLSNLCIDSEYDDDLMPFYELYYGWIDLDYGGPNWHYPEADKNNIERIVREESIKWLQTYNREKSKI